MDVKRLAEVLGLRRIPIECAQCGALTSVGCNDKGALRQYIDVGLLIVWCPNCTPHDDEGED